MQNQTILNKADLAVSDLVDQGGYLLPAQAASFMRVLMDEATLLKQARVVPMKAPKQFVEKIRFGSRILRSGSSGTALDAADRVQPDLGSVELDAQLFRAEVHLADEALEDNIERGALKDTILHLMAQRVALDMEEIILQGDTESADPFLGSFDGILKQATGNVMDHSTDANPKTHQGLFYKMLKAMPSEFKRDKRALRAYVSTNSEIDYRESLAERQTVLGDHHTKENAHATAAGVPVVGLPTMPDGQALLINPQNITVGIWRQIKVEMDKDVSAGQLIIVLSVRFHARLAVAEAAVKTTGITVPVASQTTVGPGPNGLGGRVGDFTFSLTPPPPPTP